MRVICIDDSTDTDSQLAVDVKYGSIYTVIETEKKRGIVWYYLAEMDPDDGYSSDGFAPLSDIDETELLKERQKQEVVMLPCGEYVIPVPFKYEPK